MLKILGKHKYRSTNSPQAPRKGMPAARNPSTGSGRWSPCLAAPMTKNSRDPERTCRHWEVVFCCISFSASPSLSHSLSLSLSLSLYLSLPFLLLLGFFSSLFPHEFLGGFGTFSLPPSPEPLGLQIAPPSLLGLVASWPEIAEAWKLGTRPASWAPNVGHNASRNCCMHLRIEE